MMPGQPGRKAAGGEDEEKEGGVHVEREEGFEGMGWEKSGADWLLSSPLGWIEGSGGKAVQVWCEVLSCERKRQRGERQRTRRKVVSFSVPFFQSFLNPFSFFLARESWVRCFLSLSLHPAGKADSDVSSLSLHPAFPSPSPFSSVFSPFSRTVRNSLLCAWDTVRHQGPQGQGFWPNTDLWANTVLHWVRGMDTCPTALRRASQLACLTVEGMKAQRIERELCPGKPSGKASFDGYRLNWILKVP